MTRKMQAAQVERFGQPLVPNELDISTPDAGQIHVKTEARGVCTPICMQPVAIGR